MKKNTPQFLLIDDDELNNSISRIIIKKIFGDVKITEFTKPELGFQFVRDYVENDAQLNETIVLLDINMPTMTGWDFLKKFNNLPLSQIKYFKIYILTSSIDPIDLEQAEQNSYVLNLIQKPLSKIKLLAALELAG